MKKIKIRWFDGFIRIIEVLDYQFGSDNYWFKLRDGSEEWFPKNRIRRVKIYPNEHS